MNEWQKRGKEAKPEDTVKRIQKLLDSLGFQVKTTDMLCTAENCFSCRLTISNLKGDIFGTNGKGMTKELCLASAYGEMIERLSNRIFSGMPRIDDEHYEDFLLDHVPFDDLSGENEHPCVTRLIRKIAATASSPFAWESPEDLVRSTMKKLSPDKMNGHFQMLPFYSVSEDKTVYLPTWINRFIGSNGMAAGNTYEEALIEGLSELLERYSQMKIMDGNMIPPELPKECIERYPHIHEVIQNIEKSGLYRVRVLDCSLGMGLPVVCGIIINLETGRFGVKFGCQPNMAIALERIFTESFQGSSLEATSKRSKPVFKESHRINKWNSLKSAAANMPAQLLMNEPTYPYSEWEDVAGLSNAATLKKMLKIFEDLGSELFIRDVSYLGFPAVLIYAEGVSEVRPADFLQLKMELLQQAAAKHFRHIDRLTDDEVKELAIFASSRRGSLMDNTISHISQLYFSDKMPGGVFQADYLYAACQYRLGNLKTAVSVLHSIDQFYTIQDCDHEEARRIHAAYEYLSGLQEGLPESQVYSVIHTLFPGEAPWVREVFQDRMAVLGKLYPICDDVPLADISAGGSLYPEIRSVHKILCAAENRNPVDPEIIRSVFRSL